MDSYTLIKQNLPRRAKKRIKPLSEMEIDVFTQHRANMIESINTSIEDDKFIYEYSCAMLNLNDFIAEKVIDWSKKYIPENCLYIDPDIGIDGYEEIPHVTIKYGLHETNPKIITDLVKGFGPITLHFGRITKFDINPNFDVIKIEIKSNRLHKLNQLITENMVATDSFKEYIPHATLAFVKKGTCDNILGDESFNKLKDEVYEIYYTTRTGEEFIIGL